MTDGFKWMRVSDELPDSGSTIAVRLADGLEHNVCVFALRRQAMEYAARNVDEMYMAVIEGRIQNAIAFKGEYQLMVWEGFKSYEIKFEEVVEWKYKHRINEFTYGQNN